jgi:hypothetical protein
MATAYSPIYRKYIDEKNSVKSNQIVRAKFYQIKQYEYVDGTKGTYSEANAPIIFTLFVSKAQDVVHAIKVSDVRPELIKRFFGKMVNQDTELLEMSGPASRIYENIVKKTKIIKNDAYRTYKLSGLGRILELDIEIGMMTPKNNQAAGIDPKSQVKNR